MRSTVASDPSSPLEDGLGAKLTEDFGYDRVGMGNFGNGTKQWTGAPTWPENELLLR